MLFYLVALPLVAASLYPTQPVQATVWSADQPVLITWIDDGRYPTLNQTGLMDIWLWRDTSTCIARLASEVDPTAQMQRVVVGHDVVHPTSVYTLRFTSSEPIHTVVYSADFKVLPVNTTVPVVNATGTTGFGTRTMSKVPMGTPPPSGTVSSNGQAQAQRVANAGRRGVDVEKLKFRFVFVIWPVLMGITMAL